MNTKRFWLAVVAVIVLLFITDWIVHGGILLSTYESEGVKEAFRTMDDMQSKMWITYVLYIVWAYFFTFIFVKGYENKGIMEGVKFGVYIGLFYSFVSSYGNYTLYPVPYSLALQWFIFGLIQCVIFGIAVALIYKPASAATSSEN
jgi:hypothetical protein